YDLKANSFHLRIQLIDPLPLAAFYEISGQVFLNPLQFFLIIFNVISGPINVVFEIKGDMRKSQGINYYKLKNANVDLNIDDCSFQFECLFDNNQQLGRMTNEMLNSNSIVVVKALTPMFEKLSKIGTMALMKTLTKIPYYKLFPLQQ
ncbi:hypothetical protein ILUMI_25800, partial [Ignelater luminosus]